MPIYEYQCGECRGVSERISINVEGDVLYTCSCGGVMQRIFSAPASLQVSPTKRKDH